jgi:hypothetical protein
LRAQGRARTTMTRRSPSQFVGPERVATANPSRTDLRAIVTGPRRTHGRGRARSSHRADSPRTDLRAFSTPTYHGTDSSSPSVAGRGAWLEPLGEPALRPLSRPWSDPGHGRSFWRDGQGERVLRGLFLDAYPWLSAPGAFRTDRMKPRMRKAMPAISNQAEEASTNISCLIPAGAAPRTRSRRSRI